MQKLDGCQAYNGCNSDVRHLPTGQAMEAEMEPGALAEELAAAQETADRLTASITSAAASQAAC